MCLCWGYKDIIGTVRFYQLSFSANYHFKIVCLINTCQNMMCIWPRSPVIKAQNIVYFSDEQKGLPSMLYTNTILKLKCIIFSKLVNTALHFFQYNIQVNIRNCQLIYYEIQLHCLTILLFFFCRTQARLQHVPLLQHSLVCGVLNDRFHEFLRRAHDRNLRCCTRRHCTFSHCFSRKDILP